MPVEGATSLVRRPIVIAGLVIAVGLGAIAAGQLPAIRSAMSGPTAGVTGSATQGPSSTPSSPATPSAAPSPSPSPAASPTLATPSPTAPAALDKPGIRERLQAALDRARVSLAAPGISASILLPDGTLWAGVAGVADLAKGRALTTATPFAVASISKTFLAAEILTLVEAGKLTLAVPVARLLPGVLVGGRPIDGRITVHELLDHTSGLRDYLVDAALDAAALANPTRVWTPTEALAYAGKALAAPGVGYHYANTNYVLLGLIAERITGRTLAAEYRARFFGPLAMRTAYYQGKEPPSGDPARAYRYASLKLDAIPVDVSDGTTIRPFTAITTAAGAAGSVAASPSDLARWARALYGGHVLSPTTIAAMVADAATTETLKPAGPYGLGVQVYDIDGRPSYGHSGRLVGARSIMRWFPDEGIAIAIVTNESRFDPTNVLRDLLLIVSPHSMRGMPVPQ